MDASDYWRWLMMVSSRRQVFKKCDSVVSSLAFFWLGGRSGGVISTVSQLVDLDSMGFQQFHTRQVFFNRF